MTPRHGSSGTAYRIPEETSDLAPVWEFGEPGVAEQGDLQQLNEARFLAGFCCAVFGERDPRQVCATAASWLHRYFGFREASFSLEGAGADCLSFPATAGQEGYPSLQPGVQRFFTMPETPQHEGLDITVRFPAGQGSLMLREAQPSPTASAGFLDGIAECLGAALDKASEYQQLQELSLRDGLTGLLNRRAFEELLAIEEERRDDRPYSVVMIDIDNFKRLNDGYGHLAGDRVIAAVAGVIRDALRGADLATRYGGEEFSVLLPGTAAHDALGVAERIRCRIEELDLEFAATRLKVTASLGVAGRSLREEYDLKELVALADQALYRAKRSGKNVSILQHPAAHPA